MPGSGKSGTSRINPRIASISTTSPALALGRWLPLALGSGPCGSPAPGGRSYGRSVAGGCGHRSDGFAIARDAGGRDRRSAGPGRLRLLLTDLTPGFHLLVSRLVLLEECEHRRRDEDRRVGTGRDADEHREREVLQGVAAEEQERQDRKQHDER